MRISNKAILCIMIALLTVFCLAFAVGGETSPTPDEVLAFDFTDNMCDWPTESATDTVEYYYDGTNYCFSIEDTKYDGTNQGLRIGKSIGLPKIEGFALKEVVATVNNADGTAVMKISNSKNGNPVSGGAAQTWSGSEEYTYTLQGTEANTTYYLVNTGDDKTELTRLKLTYEKALTIAEVIATNEHFPVSFDTAWRAGSNYRVYSDGDYLVFANSDNTWNSGTAFALSDTVSRVAGGYQYLIESSDTITFSLVNGVLDCLTPSCGVPRNTINGTYEHVHATYQFHELVVPTCVPGHVQYYECDCGMYSINDDFSSEITDINAWLGVGGEGYRAPVENVHQYVFDSFVWSDEYTAQAKYVCANDESHIAYYDAVITEETTTQPTVAACGEKTYTATYDGHTDTKTEVLAKLENSGADDEEILPEEGEGLSTGAIVGISAGSVAGACVIAYVVMFFVWRKKAKTLRFLTPSFRWINAKIFKK